MFIAFWVIWLALFAGAIALIVFSPRQEVNPDKAWYQVTNTYEVTLICLLMTKLTCLQIFVPAFKNGGDNNVDVGDFAGIQQELGYLTKLKVVKISKYETEFTYF